MSISLEEIKELNQKLNKLVDEAAALYLSDAEISTELADKLGTMWEMCRDYIRCM
jgi:hypothetical protein